MQNDECQDPLRIHHSAFIILHFLIMSVLWIVFSLECVIFLCLAYWLGRSVLVTLGQARRTVARIQPVIREALVFADEARPVLERTRILAANGRELAQMAQQTQAQAKTSLETVKKARDLKQSFLHVRSLARVLLPQKHKPQSRIRALGTKISGLFGRHPKKNWQKILLPAGLGALLGSSLLLAIRRLRHH